MKSRFANMSLLDLAIAVAVLRTCVFMTGFPDAIIIAVLFTARAADAYMRSKQTADSSAAQAKQQEQLATQVSQLASQLAAIKADHERIAKQAEDTQSLLSKGNLVAAFGPRK